MEIQYKLYKISSLRTKSIKVDKNIINLVKGNSEQIKKTKITLGFNLLQDKINQGSDTYKSLDETVATVDENGKVKAVGIGTTYITIHNTENDLYASVKVNVNYDDNNNVTTAKVAAGNNHFIALKSNGTAYTWGYNGYGQLGTGDGANRLTMTQQKYQWRSSNRHNRCSSSNKPYISIKKRWNSVVSRRQLVWSIRK